MKYNKGKLQGARFSKKKLKGSQGCKPESLRPKVLLEEKAKQSLVAVSQREEQVGPDVPRTSKGHGPTTWPGAQGRQAPTVEPQVIFVKTHRHRIPTGDTEELQEADSMMWFEGLPTRVHLPGPRVMCRSSTQRWVKRCCTRFCSASLELPMCHPYRVRCDCQVRSIAGSQNQNLGC